MALTETDLHKIKHLFDDRFDQIDNRFENIDNRFENIDSRFENIENRFDLIDKKFDRIDNRLQGVDDHFDRLEKRIDATRDDIDDLARFCKIQFDEHTVQLNRLNDNMIVVKDMVKDHSFRIARLEHQVFPSQ